MKYELLPTIANAIGPLMQVVVAMPIIPVVHHLDLKLIKDELLNKIKARIERPTHSQAMQWIYNGLEKQYPDAFFSSATQQGLFYSVSDLVSREHIVEYFAEKNVSVKKITFSKLPSEVFAAPRDFGEEWYAIVEEAKQVIPSLSEHLGAV